MDLSHGNHLLGWQALSSIFLATLFTLITHAGLAQQYLLEGKVTEANGQGIGHATIQIDKKTVLADHQGFYKVDHLKEARVEIRVQAVGFTSYINQFRLQPGKNTLDVTLSEKREQLKEISVTGLTDLQRVNRQAFNVNTVDATKLYNSTLKLSDALDRVSGIRVRESGGLGSNMNLSLNGFSGNHIRFFIDGVPMDNMGTSFQINNIPINLAERIEVYKGVVPIWLGSDALGGAINIVTGGNRRNYVEASYSYGSFNTHRTVVNAAATSRSGWTFQVNAYQNYSDNNYKVFIEKHNNRPGNYLTSTEVSRFHDNYHNETIIANVGVVDKSYADKLLFGVMLGENYKEIQTGARMEAVFGAWHRRGNIVMPTLKYSKKGLIKGLDVMVNAHINLGSEQSIDTVNRRFDWFGDMGVELPATSGERSRTMYKYKNNEGIATANFNYSINKRQMLTLNNVFNTFSRIGNDPLNERNNEYELAKKSNKNVLGLGYQYQIEGKWSMTLFGKLLAQRNKNGAAQGEHMHRFGYGTAASYFIHDKLQLKASYELTNRMPTPYEIFGDVENLDGNPSLKPEKSNNVNLGMNYQFDVRTAHLFSLNTGLIYRFATDFIYQRLAMNKYTTDNREGVRTIGADAEIRYFYKNCLSAGTSWTYQHLQNTQMYEDGYVGVSPVYKDQMPNIPYFFGNADVNFLFKDLGRAQNSLHIGYNMQYIHAFYLYWPGRGTASTKNDIPMQLSHDVNMVYSLADGRYNIGLEARNIANTRLYDNFSLQKAGRAFYVNFRYFIHK